ncbi:uncharacterized protein EI97DRAFT_375139 [Westerdykella ornata]|uniref:Uncharacterized protein n=1 Tax=Westerdykella ornata TaxID=318751 RepID=A0A6A6JPR0_WESOR|nr:uncharacterized protein EI97DRAFT_375139 [Westerdykella ornata]KAF2277666.1 hypothetical protein EI97DRAFT_375139 [Westerdykella ornata]
MFVPRVLRLKGTNEKAREATRRPPRTPVTEFAAQPDQNADSPSSAGPLETEAESHQAKTKQSTEPASSPEYLAQLIAGIELIFTDYAHQDPESVQWLQERYRVVEGEEKYIHLSAVLQHDNISSLKPAACQLSLQKAIRSKRSDYLELSKNGHFVRRRPETYPMRFIPEDSFEIEDDQGVTFWDQRTIYVEPHRRDLFRTPAKVAHWLKEHGGMREKWLPIQAVIPLYNSAGFVVLSGNVTHESVWRKWRRSYQPDKWKVLTKVEHMRHRDEYITLKWKERKEREERRAAKKREGKRMEKKGTKRSIADAGLEEDDLHGAGTNIDENQEPRTTPLPYLTKRKKTSAASERTGDAGAMDTLDST